MPLSLHFWLVVAAVMLYIDVSIEEGLHRSSLNPSQYLWSLWIEQALWEGFLDSINDWMVLNSNE